MVNRLKKAFTLVELMIAMVIIAVLVGLVLPKMKGMRDQGSISKAQGEVRAIKAAMESYFIRTNGYPPISPTFMATYLAAATNNPRVLNAPLYDPFANNTTTEYQYMISPSGRYYVIFSVGADQAANITGIGNDGVVTPANRGDDIWTTNSQ